MPSAGDKPLFRREVFEARSQSWLGTISLAQPMRWPLMAGLALAMACAVLGLLAFGSYAPRIRLSGQVVVHAAAHPAARAELSAPASAVRALAAGDGIVLHLEGDAGQHEVPGRIASIARAVDGGHRRILVDVPATRLRPGMHVEADIRGERRRLYEWAFAPLAR
jgi:hypothetical protein